MRRSCLIVELKDGFYLTTHLAAGNDKEDRLARKAQIERINQEIAIIQKSSDKPIFFLGDFNLKNTFEEDSEYKKSCIEDLLVNLDNAQSLNQETATCTNFLTAHKACKNLDPKDELELVDYAFISKKDSSLLNPRLQKIDTFNKIDPSNALSDHKALLVRI
jgi:endonuclease/exonuclease/phosphatase family metal-dependent hydrolase